MINSRVYLIAALMGMLSMTTQSNAQTFGSTDTPTTLLGPGNNFPVVSTINVNTPTTSITDLNVSTGFGNTGSPYMWGPDFAGNLTSPQGTTVQFMSFVQGAPGVGMSTYLYDDSSMTMFPTPAYGAPLIASGTYSPDNPLSAFNGENPNGTWTLNLVDSGSHAPHGGSFTLDAWGLVIVGTAPVAAIHRRREISTILVTDVGAIYSTMTSGLGMGLVNQQVTQGAPNAALRDYDSRLFRARSGRDDIFADGFESGDVSSWRGTSISSSSLLRHLAFVQDENMSYKVALGLADPEERTVEINVADTLSAQTGTNFNGQSLGGGLPYAMMGVPLMPMVGGAATVQIVEAVPSGKTVIDDSKAVVEIAPRNQWEVFVAGDFSFYDQDQLTDLMQGFDTDTYAGTVGIEYRVKDWLNLGLGWSYLQSDTNVSGNYGDIDLEGNLITGYATAFWRQYWADILYSYGTFNNDINRNTGLGSRARGDTDSQSHNIRLNFGRNFNVGNNITTGPIAGLQYANGDIDPYSERGGGSAALDYDGTDFESMVSQLGWQATHYRSTNWGRLVSQAHLAWEHEYMPENGTVGASLQTSPFALVTGSNVRRVGGFSAEDDGAHPGTDWLSAGAGLRFELANGVAFLTDYEGVFFRSNASQHYASAKLSYEWGAIIPSGGGGKAVSSGKAVAYEAYDAAPSVADTEDPGPAPATKPEAEVAVIKKKTSGNFASWLNRKGR